MKRSTLLSLVMAMVAITGAAPQAAAANKTMRVYGPDGYTVELECSPVCPHYTDIDVTWTPLYEGGYEVELSCTSGACDSLELTVPTPPTRVESDGGDDFFGWSLAAEGFGLGVQGGPGGGGAGGLFEARLRMSGDWWFVFQSGVGFAHLEGKTNPTLTELAGVTWRGNAFNLTLGARHRLAFDGSSDTLNAVMAEIGASYQFTQAISLGLYGDLGAAWYEKKGPAPGLWPAGVQPPVESKRTTGIAGGVSLRFSYNF